MCSPDHFVPVTRGVWPCGMGWEMSVLPVVDGVHRHDLMDCSGAVKPDRAEWHVGGVVVPLPGLATSPFAPVQQYGLSQSIMCVGVHIRSVCACIRSVQCVCISAHARLSGAEHHTDTCRDSSVARNCYHRADV